MTITNDLCGKVAAGLQFVIGHKGGYFFFADAGRRTNFRRNAALFHVLHHGFRNRVGIIPDVVLKMGAVLSNVVGPNLAPVLEVYHVGGSCHCAGGDREEKNEAARTHNSRF